MSILPLYYFNNANMNRWFWFSVLNYIDLMLKKNSRQMPRDVNFAQEVWLGQRSDPHAFAFSVNIGRCCCFTACVSSFSSLFSPLPKTWGFSHSQLLFGWINVKARKSIREKYHFFPLLHVKTKYILPREDYLYLKSWQPLLISCEFPNISCQEFSLPSAVCQQSRIQKLLHIFSPHCPCCDECGSCGIAASNSSVLIISMKSILALPVAFQSVVSLLKLNYINWMSLKLEKMSWNPSKNSPLMKNPRFSPWPPLHIQSDWKNWKLELLRQMSKYGVCGRNLGTWLEYHQGSKLDILSGFLYICIQFYSFK